MTDVSGSLAPARVKEDRMSMKKPETGPAPAGRPTGSEPDERKDRVKAAIFFFGTIALMFVIKLILGI